MSRLYGVVDCARDPRLFAMVKACPEHSCLFAGKLGPELEKTAPYLVGLEEDTELKRVWRDEGWGDHHAWGILCRSALDIDRLRRHLKKFLMAKLPDGQVVLFRFYDPRVWRVYWPTLSETDKERWLKGVDEIVLERS